MPVQHLPAPPRKPGAKRSMRPPNHGPRIRREKRTIAAMLMIYCHDHHGGTVGGQLCEGCDSLRSYAEQRLDNCVFGEMKEPCNLCAVHCYSKSLRPRIVEVMRYAGPRMTLRFPILSALHLFDKLRSR